MSVFGVFVIFNKDRCDTIGEFKVDIFFFERVKGVDEESGI